MYTRPLLCCSVRQKERKKRKKNYESSKKLLTSFWEKGPLGKKSPFTRKEKGGQSVRIRRVASRQASRPLLIGLKDGRMLENVWSEQAYEHSAQNGHGV